MMKPSTLVTGAFALATMWACDRPPPEATDLVAQELDCDPMLGPMPNAAGWARTATATGQVDTGSPFFASLGTNGRSCGTCHLASQGWTITPWGVQARFDASDGLDPLFRPHDGANAPHLDVSTTSARRNAYSLLLERGVIRIGLPVKPTSEFELIAVDDPYNHASAAQLSLFRRPLPTTNLRFLTAINWDGRNNPAADPTNIRLGLENQANGATVNHAQATAPIAQAIRAAIVDLELALATAQHYHRMARLLDARGGRGGPLPLLTLPFTPGANDPGLPGFDRRVFKLYDAWEDLGSWGTDRERSRIQAGQEVFNLKTFTTAGGTLGTCSGCHAVPEVGGAPTFRMFDIGVSAPERRASNVPLYTFRNLTTGAVLQTTDPGRALITGLWADMNRFKVPGLRALAARAPYFHDGSARDLEAVVDHYEERFSIEFSGEEKENLVRFLESL